MTTGKAGFRAAAAAVFVATLLAGAAGVFSTAARAADVIVGESTTLENEYWGNWDKGAKAAADALGLDYKALTDGGDPAKQLSIYEAQL